MLVEYKFNIFRGPSVTSTKINKSRQYNGRSSTSRSVRTSQSSRRFSSNKKAPLFNQSESDESSTTTISISKPQTSDGRFSRPGSRKNSSSQKEYDNESVIEDEPDELESSQTSIDYLDLQTETMVTNVIQDSPLITKRSSSSLSKYNLIPDSRAPSPISISRYPHSRAGSIYSYHETIEEEDETNEEETSSNKFGPLSPISRSVSRLSLDDSGHDSGHASLFSDEDRPDSVFKAKLRVIILLR